MTTSADQPLEDQTAQMAAYLRRRQAVHPPDVEELEGHLRDRLARSVTAVRRETGGPASLMAIV